ncbi:MAG: ELM1/GtrOC1 family putative glycosyltransferase [Gammaproteobacteria bacterium]
MNNQSPTVVWRFTDGHPGHDSQSLGLTSALGELAAVEQFDFDVQSMRVNFLNVLFKRFPNIQKFPAPDLLIGAGHSTHWPMLAARRALGGKIIVLMKPSLPVSWFDAVVVPRHDNLSVADNIFLTEGALNSIHPGQQHQSGLGLILLGGPSAEYSWEPGSIVDQVNILIMQQPDIRWMVTSSRRTPPDILERFSLLDNTDTMPHTLCQPGWLAEKMALSGEIWVTEDSVSMLYEALSSGARVGLIKVPREKQGRVSSGVDALVKQGRIPEPGSFQLTRQEVEPLQEALRCAYWITKQWLNR